MRTYFLALLMLMPMLAQAQAYKCKQPDGTLSFQDRPCPAGAASSTLALPPVTGGSSGPASQPKGPDSAKGPKALRTIVPGQDTERDNQRRRADEEVRAHNKEVDAYNKTIRCNNARQQLGVLKESRPVYSRDDKGERQYISDDNRPAKISAAEQRVAEECR